MKIRFLNVQVTQRGKKNKEMKEKNKRKIKMSDLSSNRSIIT